MVQTRLKYLLSLYLRVQQVQMDQQDLQGHPDQPVLQGRQDQQEQPQGSALQRPLPAQLV